MYHSVNIESVERKEAYNTYESFIGHLIPSSRPLIKSPEVKKSYVDIPGANGALDYTEALNGLLYNNRKGSWEFYVDNNYQNKDDNAWNVMYSDLLNSIHGKYFDHIWLEDDTREDDGLPNYYYKGRVFVNEWKSDPQFSKVVLDYELEPYKYPSPKEGSTDDWLWDSLFNDETVNPIIYGKFKVSESKDRTLVGSPNKTVTAFTSTNMSVTLPNGQEVQIPANTSTEFNLSRKGTDRVTFHGVGEVELFYEEGPKL